MAKEIKLRIGEGIAGRWAKFIAAEEDKQGVRGRLANQFFNQALREFLDRSENAESGNQQFRNPSPIYPPGTDQIKFPSIRNTRWDHAINVLRTAQENIAQALDTLTAVTHDEHAGDSDLPTGAELERQVDAALKTRTPSVKKAVEAAGKSGGNRAADKGDTKGNRGRKRA